MASVTGLLNCHFFNYFIITTNLQSQKAIVNSSHRITLLFLGLLTEDKFV